MISWKPEILNYYESIPSRNSCSVISSKRCSTLSALDGGYSAGGWGEGVEMQKEQHRVWKNGTSCMMDESEWKVRSGNSIRSDLDSPTVPFSSWKMQVKLKGSVKTLNKLQFQNSVQKHAEIWKCFNMCL